ncbi:hypothetical protein Csa_003939 [Cucumis sativus]|uniref:Uncharacterized protein n=1 Tax=Cucumis sativus TaxID=3659 RepID=A0A0A0KK63_CUCSA|nr:hypothetical protein Csa_003939 [Cucumis sativus]
MIIPFGNFVFCGCCYSPNFGVSVSDDFLALRKREDSNKLAKLYLEEAPPMAKNIMKLNSWVVVAPILISYPQKPSTIPSLEPIFEDVVEDYPDDS